MHNKQIKHTLFQFKRIHKRQIAPHHPVLPVEIQSQINRKVMRTMSEKEIHNLAKRIILSIDTFQKQREKPHKGLILFTEELSKLI